MLYSRVERLKKLKGSDETYVQTGSGPLIGVMQPKNPSASPKVIYPAFLLVRNCVLLRVAAT
jgi:hypothetical protein